METDADDELDTLSNFCTDLVSVRKWEPLLLRLFQNYEAGKWVSVTKLVAEAGFHAGAVPLQTLSVSWMRTPNPNYRILTFLETDSMWSMHADYNFERLRQAAVQRAVPQANPESFDAYAVTSFTQTSPIKARPGQQFLSRRRAGQRPPPRSEMHLNRAQKVA